MLIYGPLVTLLQKHDLLEGDLGEFREMLKDVLPKYVVL